jgi:hypothetical protein
MKNRHEIHIKKAKS